MKRRAQLVATFLAVVVVCSACTLSENAHYEVNNTGISGVNVTLYEIPTNQIATVYGPICNRNINCTVDLFDANVHLEGTGAAEWNTGIHEQRNDLADILDDLISQGVLNNWNAGGPCLVINKWVDWLLPYTHQRWTSFGGNHYSCKQGTQFAA